MRKRLFGLLISAMFVHSVAADTPAFTPSPDYLIPPRNFTGTRGWAFSNGGPVSVTITAVGVWDFGGDGLANSHEVGVWGNSGDLLGSANVPAGTKAALTDGYRYVPISPVIIAPRARGIIGAAYLVGDLDDQFQPWWQAYNGPIVEELFVTGRYGYGEGLPFPSNYETITCEVCAHPIYWEPNFKFEIIPEPQVSAFLGLGFVAWVLVRRKNGNRTGIIRVTKLDGASGNKALVSGVLFGG